MEELTADDIQFIHEKLESRYKITKGATKLDLLNSIAERPSTFLFDTFTPYDDIYSKASSLMEGIIRLHPFTDGNKRTALATVIAYLNINSYALVVPFNAVRLTVEIAKNEKNDEESTKKLINDTAVWLSKRSGKSFAELFPKIIKYVIIPSLKLLLMDKFGRSKQADQMVSYWLAFDIYPEYEQEAVDMARFLVRSMLNSISNRGHKIAKTMKI